jgi:hypothetical protein
MLIAPPQGRETIILVMTVNQLHVALFAHVSFLQWRMGMLSTAAIL